MAVALKLQFAEEEPGKDATVDADYTGGEPKMGHDTVKLPGMPHGIEIDPATAEQEAEARELFPRLNALLAQIEFGGRRLVFRLMDSDGHP